MKERKEEGEEEKGGTQVQRELVAERKALL